MQAATGVLQSLPAPPHTCTGQRRRRSQRYINFVTRVIFPLQHATRGSMTFDTCQPPKSDPSQLDRLFFGPPRIAALFALLDVNVILDSDWLRTLPRNFL